MLCRLQARSDAEASAWCSQGAVFMPAFWECLIQASFLGKDGARMVHPAPWFHCLSSLDTDGTKKEENSPAIGR